ncbi:NAD(P)-binding protein [Hanseniaspora valbyensis NRRL Y-1626]|uniref:NAD(P)-binding protein n=1 Tax=Hanseniaspora valbyensis NRRL Y-1626 TaxID=766949 RepID=A0A1B7TCC3_9ASCO|nr:NAD(P)-binding protein [Hanseniaspora valbyensis NRRL Y-1626]
MTTEKQTVFLSGASGFIAQHTIKQLLDAGKFKVIGSVRSEDKANSLAKNFNNNPDLSFVYVKDIAEETAFDEAFKEHGSKLDFVIHSASPFTFDITDINKDLIIPAKVGSAGIFKASVNYAPNLKHFVVTSSYAAINDLLRETDNTYHLNENTWNPMPFDEALANPIFGYCYSKKVAEQTVWKLTEELNAKFNVTAVNPVFVFGPQCFDSSVTKVLNTSCEIVNKFVHSTPETEVDESIKGSYIDVRDIARAHIEPLLDSDKFNGKRLLMDGGRFGNQAIVDVLNTIPQLKGKIAVGTPHKDDDIENQMAVIDNSATKKLLNFEFMNLEQTVKDTALQILKVEGKA